jgi:hypothetical protein
MQPNEKTHGLYALLQQLDRARIHYILTRVRDDTVMIVANVPGRRYEIEVFSDGALEVEVFGPTGPIGGQEALDDLFANYSDSDCPEHTA